MGIYHIDHIAITRIDSQQTLLALSSTPALEFNLFGSDLWQFDNSYHAEWFCLGTHASWQSLYSTSHYDELYYTKQLKHHFSNGLSIAFRENMMYYIYSLATSSLDPAVQETFNHHHDKLGKIGQYCLNRLKPIFHIIDENDKDHCVNSSGN